MLCEGSFKLKCSTDQKQRLEGMILLYQSPLFLACLIADRFHLLFLKFSISKPAETQLTRRIFGKEKVQTVHNTDMEFSAKIVQLFDNAQIPSVLWGPLVMHLHGVPGEDVSCLAIIDIDF
jgi:hypothetical protein